MALVEQVERAGERPRPVRSPAPEPQRQQRLTPEQWAEVVRAYEAGTGTVELAEQYRVHRDVVRTHLKDAGVLRAREALTQTQVDETVRLRSEGLNYREIGERFGVHKDTVRRAVLRRQSSSN